MTITEIKQSLQDAKAHYTAIGDVALLRDKAILAYALQVVDKLEQVLAEQSDDSMLADALEKCLADNWKLVGGTALSYTALPSHPVTSLLCQVAHYVADIKKQNAIEMLMPGIIIDSISDDVKYPDLNANADILTQLKTHVLSEDGLSLLPVTLLTDLDLSPTPVQLVNPYYDYQKSSGNGFINNDEYKRLTEHSVLTRAIVETKQNYEQLTSDNSTLLGQLQQLCKQLGIYGVSGLGQETNAAGGAYPAIISFMDYYTRLQPCGLQLLNRAPLLDDLPADRDIAYCLVQSDTAPERSELYFINRFDKDHPVKPVNLNNLKFGLSLISVTSEADIPAALSKRHPTLIQIQNTNQYQLYGCTSEHTWGLTTLDAAVVSNLFPEKRARSTQIPLGNVPDAVYDEIASKQAHTQTLATNLDEFNLTTAITTATLLQLTAITDMTGHNFLTEKSAIPPGVQTEINLLYDLVRNPTKNTNATENLATCIASRKTTLISNMTGKEAQLSAISLSATNKQSLVAGAQQQFEAAKADLTQAIATNSYHDGHDKLHLNTALLAVLNIKLNIASLADLNLLKELTPAEITSVCSEEGLRQQIVMQLGSLENLVLFIMDMPTEKLTAFLHANHQEISNTFIQSPGDFSALLMSLEVEKCTLVSDVIKDKLPDIIKSPFDLIDVLRDLSPEQCTAVMLAINVQLTNIIKSAEDFQHVLEFLKPEQCTAVCNVIKARLPDIIKSADDFRLVIRYLNLEKFTAVCNVMKDRLPDIIKSPEDLVSILGYLSPEECTVVMLANDAQITNIIKSSAESSLYFYSVLARLTSIQRTAVYDVMKDKLPDIIKSGGDFDYVVEYLLSEQRTEVFDMMKNRLPDIISSSSDFMSVLEILTQEQRTAVYYVMKDNLPDFIESAKDFIDVFRYLIPEQRTAIYDVMKDRFPYIIKSDRDLKWALRYINPEQQATLISMEQFKKNMVLAAVDDAEATALASALMSDNNTRIKEQFDQLILHSKTPDALIMALSQIEPRWMEKINVAAELKLTTEQLTSKPCLEKSIMQYIGYVLEEKKNVTQHYKQVLESITPEAKRLSDYKKIATEIREQEDNNAPNVSRNKLGN